MSKKLLGFVLALITLTASATQVMASDNTINTPTASFTISTDNIYPAGTTPKIGIQESKNLGQDFVSIFRQLIGQSPKHTLKITDPAGEIELREINGDTTEIPLPTAALHPGTYHLAVDGQPVTDFSWGVLVINTSQSVYKTGDTAYIQMASLDSSGHTLCDSRLQIIITDPQGRTENTGIAKSQSCGADNVTDSPDYYSYYKTTISGIYRMKLTNLDNKFETESSFQVEDTLPVKVERIGATRINPFKSSYTMTIKITADQDWSGIIKEEVPQSFQIINSQTNWDTVLKAGVAKTFSYTYQAPNITPQIFLLGPLTVGNFRESQQWQLASDSPTSNSFQRKTWYDTTDALYWRSSNDTANSRIMFEYSSNGTSWTENTTARITVNTNDFSVETDSTTGTTYLFIVYTTSNDIRGRAATSYPGTGFGWSGETTVFNGTGASDDYSYPVISRDSSSQVWVLARYTGSSIYYIKTIKDATTNTLPVDTSDSVYSISDITNANSNIYGNIVPLTTGQMYAMWVRGTTIEGKLYSGSDGTVSKSISKTADEGTEWSTSGFSTTDPNDVAGSYSALVYNSFYCFNNATMSGTITNSYIKFIAHDASTGSPKISVYGVKADNPSAPTSHALMDGLALTSANVSWNASNWSANAATTSASLNAIFQELVNNFTISNDNVIVELRDNASGGTNYNSTWDYSGASASAALLHVDYSGWDYASPLIATGSSGISNSISVVADSSGNTHMVYIDQNGHAVYQKRTSSWQTAVTLDSNSGNAYPTISLNTSTGDIYAFWIRGNHIYYKKAVSPYASGDWDASATDWKTTGTNTDVTANYSGAGYIFAEWYDGSNVQWGKVLPSSNSAPNTPSLNSPTDTATNQSIRPMLKTTATDPNSDYLEYKITLCENSGMSANCKTFDETGDQTGWIGQDANGGLAYASGTQAIYTIQSADTLQNNKTYYWESYAFDPTPGSNSWSGTQASPYSFTTVSSGTFSAHGLNLKGFNLN